MIGDRDAILAVFEGISANLANRKIRGQTTPARLEALPPELKPRFTKRRGNIGFNKDRPISELMGKAELYCRCGFGGRSEYLRDAPSIKTATSHVGFIPLKLLNNTLRHTLFIVLHDRFKFLAFPNFDQ